MGRREAARLLAALLLASLSVPGRAGELRPRSRIRLWFEGAAGTGVRLDCRVLENGRVRRLRETLRPPAECVWRAAGLDCRLEASGPVVVEAVSGGSRSRIATSGGTLRLRLGRPLPAE